MGNKKMPVVLVDMSWLAYRALWSIGGLEYEKKPTGVIFGMLNQLLAMCRNPHILSNQVALFFDSRQSYRRRAYPDYKSNRQGKNTPEINRVRRSLYIQIETMRQEISPAVGFVTYRQTGLEADDLIARAALLLSSRHPSTFIISADGDLWQCITPTVTWYNPARENLLTPETFERRTGIPPHQWSAVKCITGCAGDGVKGIHGVGEKKAVQYIKGTLPSHHKAFRAIESPLGKAMRERNRGLLVLPHEKTRNSIPERPEYNPQVFFRMCRKYGFRQYIERDASKWRAFFAGRFGPQPRKRGEKR